MITSITGGNIQLKTVFWAQFVGNVVRFFPHALFGPLTGCSFGNTQMGILLGTAGRSDAAGRLNGFGLETYLSWLLTHYITRMISQVVGSYGRENGGFQCVLGVEGAFPSSHDGSIENGIFT